MGRYDRFALGLRTPGTFLHEIETLALGEFAAERLARADGMSLNQFIAAAIAEKIGTLDTNGD